MLLLTHVLLILWISTVGGQGRHCDFPKINHGILYNEKKYKASFPVSLGKIFYYSCEYNYMPPSKYFWTPITCTEGGWSPTPKCLRVCFFPFVENGQSASSGQIYLEGATVQITCNKGYSLPDNQGSITCAEGGWSSPPECISTKTECQLPFLEANVDAYPKQEKYKVGDVLKFSCRQRLKRVGPDSVQCYQFGWSPNFPTCKGQVRSCGQPPQLPNGKMKHRKQEKYEHSEMVECDCNPNFVLKGPKKIQCMDGEWTALPTCVEPGKACGFMPQLENGYSQPSVPPYRHGVSVVLSCRNAYTMIGNTTITCIDGIWTELPKCVATNQLKRCEKPRFYTRRHLSSHMYEFNHNARVSYKCAGKSTDIQTVCIDGKWDPEPDCLGKKKQLCPPPPQIPNAQNMLTTVNYQEGEKVAVLCKENHAFLEAKELVCKSGQWQSLPHCVETAQYCGPPPPIDNGDITSFPLSAYSPGSMVQYRCQSFYELRGNLTVTCRNGRWSEPPTCIDACIISEDRMNKNNIQLKWRNPPKRYAKTGDFIEFECKHSHKERTPIQSFRVLCQEGKFEYPTCE
ncbi:complement factor H-related protein 5-like isoform X1 [Bubalus kerabau]|uniref:complement factor H-related protein 5-like isoform X1 n=1 Tax=Bubalus carabanensis TaxID=3119969 RepID=UPI00244E5EE1|nr:complement factor H-related protein 5-like isoform X1 [Bubalus carabanensis]